MTIDDKHPIETRPRLETGRPRAGVLIAIVNYCTPELTTDCLRALEAEISSHPETQVIVADNASSDGSGLVIANNIESNGWSAWARLLPLPYNGGFAYGNNEIVRDYEKHGGHAKYVWLLNSDTIVRPGALGALVTFMNANPTVGIAGSCLEDPDGTQQCSAFRFHTVASEFQGSFQLSLLARLMPGAIVAPPPERRTMPSDWVAGASMILRAEMLEQIGLMDEDYFLYFEETDYCLRARVAGWACWFVPESRVIHLVGRSSGVTGAANQTRRRSHYWFESRRRYFEKNHGRSRAIAADAALAMGTLFNRILSASGIRRAELPERFLRDLVQYSALWPMRLRGSNR